MKSSWHRSPTSPPKRSQASPRLLQASFGSKIGFVAASAISWLATSRAASANDPELALLKERSADVFKRAFAEVLAAMPPEERTIFRLYFIDQLTHEELGRVLHMSRASAARRVTEAKESVVRRVEARIRAELGDDSPHAASLFALVASQLDMSVLKHLEDSEY